MSGGADALATWDELRALRGVTETLRIADLVPGRQRVGPAAHDASSIQVRPSRSISATAAEGPQLPAV